MTDSEAFPRLLIATNNPGKVREYVTLLAGLPLTLVGLADVGITIAVPEDGATFAENALIKARAYCALSRLPTLADDSGLEVDALGGAPGVYSARYAGEGASDAIRYRKLLAELGDRPAEERAARFRCAIALVLSDGTEVLTEGTCEGVIGQGPRGANGFGYDPIFYMPALGRTMAELEPEVKDRVSHRGRAAMRLKPALRRLFT